MTPKEKEMLAAVIAYQNDVGKIAASVALATRRARQDLLDDAKKILTVFTLKGGFKTREEARAYLSQNVTEVERRVLVERARKTYKGRKLQQVLTRLSSPAYRYRITRTKALDMSAQMASDKLIEKMNSVIVPGVDDVVSEAVSRTQYSVQKQARTAIDWSLPNEGQLESVHKDIGVYHKVKLFSVQELETARDRISEGILGGQSYERITEKVSVDTDKDPYKARRLVRTTMAQAAVDAEARELQELGIEEYEIYCTLDEKTCEICGKYDGKRYRFGEGGPMPTFHPNCRCSIRQVMPEKVWEKMQRTARNSEGRSIRVPASMTYAEWREKYGPKTITKVPEVK